MKEFEKLQDRTIGEYQIEKFAISANDIRAILEGLIPGREYVKLTHMGEILMSNTPMEMRTNREFIKNAHGDILIGGLGIGLIVLNIQDKDNVNSITVIEKADEVIELLEPLPFNDKVQIIHGDVFEWKPKERYDCIYMDIWPFINSKVYKEEMVPLKRKYGHYLKPLNDSPYRFNKCWAEYEAKHKIRI